MQHRDRDIYLSVFPKLFSRIGALFFHERRERIESLFQVLQRQTAGELISDGVEGSQSSPNPRFDLVATNRARETDIY